MVVLEVAVWWGWVVVEVREALDKMRVIELLDWVVDVGEFFWFVWCGRMEMSFPTTCAYRQV